MSRILITAGIFLIVAGVFWQYGSKLGLGRLPGDFSFKSGNSGVYFPLTSSIIVSIVISLILWIVRFFKGE